MYPAPAERAGCSSPRCVTTGNGAVASAVVGGTGAAGATGATVAGGVVTAAGVAAGAAAGAAGGAAAGADLGAAVAASGAAAGAGVRGSAAFGGVNEGSWHQAVDVAESPINRVTAAMLGLQIRVAKASLSMVAS